MWALANRLRGELSSGSRTSDGIETLDAAGIGASGGKVMTLAAGASSGGVETLATVGNGASGGTCSVEILAAAGIGTSGGSVEILALAAAGNGASGGGGVETVAAAGSGGSGGGVETVATAVLGVRFPPLLDFCFRKPPLPPFLQVTQSTFEWGSHVTGSFWSSAFLFWE